MHRLSFQEIEPCSISTNQKIPIDFWQPNSTEDNQQTCLDNSTCPTVDRWKDIMPSEIPVRKFRCYWWPNVIIDEFMYLFTRLYRDCFYSEIIGGKTTHKQYFPRMNCLVRDDTYLQERCSREYISHVNKVAFKIWIKLYFSPDSTTWFGSSVPLNRTQILQDINPKTSAEYEQIKRFNESRVLDKKDNFPFYSEYTDRFAAHTKTVPILTT